MNTTGHTRRDPGMAQHIDLGHPVGEDETLFSIARNLAATLWRWRLLILAIVVAGIAAAWLVLLVQPSTYVARAAVFFDFSRQTVVSDRPADELAPSTAMLNTEMEILTSRNLMSVVVEELDLLSDPEFNPWMMESEEGAPDVEDGLLAPAGEIRDAAISILLGKVNVSLIPNSYVFTITAETLSPEKSANIANGIADLFIQERDKRRLDASEDAVAWLEQRAETLRLRVLETEDRVAAERALAAPGGEASLTSFAVRIASLRERSAEADARQSQLAVTADSIETSRAVGDLDTAARLALEEAGTTLAGEIRIALSQAEGPGRAERLDTLITEAQRQIAEAASVARAEIRTLQPQIAGALDTYSVRTAEAQKLRDSEREAAASLAAYEAMLDRLKSRVAADALDPFWPEAEVISPAVPPGFAASPNRGLILALGAVGSMVLASGLALLLNALFPVISSARDLERTTGLSVMGQVPLSTRRGLASLQQQLKRGSSALGNSLRALRVAIAIDSRGAAPRVLLLTSAEKGEGKSAMGYLLAQSFVQAGRKVLVIDADPQEGGIPGQSTTGPGLNAVLLGEVDPKDTITRDDASGIDILSAPQALRDDADLLAYGDERAILEKVAVGYDVVIVIAPPVGSLPDARILARLSDIVLLVVRRNISSPAEVIEARDLLISGGASRMASVLLSPRAG